MNKLFFLFAIFSTSAVFADEGIANPAGGMMQIFVVIAISIAFFYFIVWRPEQKRRKMAEQMRSAMKKGDRVTAMGILGKVDRIQERTVVLKMIDGSKIEMLKAAITEVEPAEDKPDISPEG